MDMPAVFQMLVWKTWVWVLRRERGCHTLAEIGRVGELGNTVGGAATADQLVEVVAGIVDPGRVELRHRLTHREAGELDERVVDAEGAAREVAVGAVDVAAARARETGPRGIEADRAAVLGRARARTGAAIVAGRPGEDRIEIGADDAVFRCGARVDVEIFTSAHRVVVGQPVVGREHAVVLGTVVAAGIERHFGTQIAAELDAGVAARDVVEARAIERADLDVLDRLGLDRKIGRLGSTDGDQTRRSAEQKALHHFHIKPPSCSFYGDRTVRPPRSPSFQIRSAALRFRTHPHSTRGT
ncbi:hypothetical protein ACVJDU_005004 [Bradyrhizobium diazoefficiens]